MGLYLSVKVFSAVKSTFTFARKIKGFKSNVVIKCILIYTLLFKCIHYQIISTRVNRWAVTHIRLSASPRADGGQQLLLLHNSTSARERKSLPETPGPGLSERCHLVTCFGRLLLVPSCCAFYFERCNMWDRTIVDCARPNRI